MISGNVPGHLLVGAQTGFLSAVRAANLPWQRVAQQLNLSGSSSTLVDLGDAPMPTNSKQGITVQDFIERTKTVTPTDWDITVWLSYNALKDDRIGDLDRKVRSAGQNFNKHLNKRVFQVLNAGDGSTYGLAYDGQYFFDSDHADAGAAYSTSQDNVGALALSLDNFQTTYVAAQGTKNDQGEYTEYVYDLLVVPPALQNIAAQIATNPNAYDTGNQEINPYSGSLQYIVSPYLDSTAWVLVASKEQVKPLLVAMREQPFLQDAWFDPKQPDGGRYYFKFFARYEVHYGLWQLAYMGNT